MEWQNMEIGGLTPVNLLAKMKNNLEYLKGKIDPIDYLDLLERVLGIEIDIIKMKEDIQKLDPSTIDALTQKVNDMDDKLTTELAKMQGEIDAVPHLLTPLQDSITVNQRAILSNSKEIGDLTTLNTDNKTDLVSAINEVLTRVVTTSGINNLPVGTILALASEEQLDTNYWKNISDEVTDGFTIVNKPSTTTIDSTKIPLDYSSGAVMTHTHNLNITGDGQGVLQVEPKHYWNNFSGQASTEACYRFGSKPGSIKDLSTLIKDTIAPNENVNDNALPAGIMTHFWIKFK